MKITTVILLSALISCKNESKAKYSNTDSIGGVTVAEWKDSTLKEIKKRTSVSMIDTVGLHKSPVVVTKSKIVEKDYSSYKDISLTYKNISGKRIEAIKFMWYGETAFGDPADMGNPILKGIGSGFDDNPLGDGKTRSGKWSITSQNAKKVIIAWPTEVVFSDESKWKIGK